MSTTLLSYNHPLFYPLNPNHFNCTTLARPAGTNERALARTCDSNRLRSIWTPRPVCCRESSAAMITPCVYSSVAMSVAATPILHGGPLHSPVLCVARGQQSASAQEEGRRKSRDCALHVHEARFHLDDDIVPRCLPIRVRLFVACTAAVRQQHAAPYATRGRAHALVMEAQMSCALSARQSSQPSPIVASFPGT